MLRNKLSVIEVLYAFTMLFFEIKKLKIKYISKYRNCVTTIKLHYMLCKP